MASKLPAHPKSENSTFVFAERHPEDPWPQKPGDLDAQYNRKWLLRGKMWSVVRMERLRRNSILNQQMSCQRDVKWERTMHLSFISPSISLIKMSISKKYLGNSQLWWNGSEMRIGLWVGKQRWRHGIKYLKFSLGALLLKYTVVGRPSNLRNWEIYRVSNLWGWDSSL